MRKTLILVLVITSNISFGQYLFDFDSTIPVIQSGKTLSMAWAGGLNSGQYNTMDLNGDGEKDLVIFDRTSNKVNTFLNQGNSYLHMPQYELFFPDNLENWIVLVDFDCDGKKDLFTSSVFGMKVYRNTTSPSSDNITWETAADPLLTNNGTASFNLQMNGGDLPVIKDLDGDSDLDILVFNFSGSGLVEFHKNMSHENDNLCDLEFSKIDGGWGDFFECDCNLFAFGQTCSELSNGRTEHIGAKSLMAYDSDNDGDMELVVGEEECNDLTLLQNVGNPDEAILRNPDNDFPIATTPVTFPLFPAVYLEDVDFDGKKDLLAAPNTFANSFFSVDFQKSNWFYKNVGSEEAPVFSFVQHDFLQDNMIDIGENTVSSFADYDGDGDLDMFLTGKGVPNSNTLIATIFLYENIGDRFNPSFELKDSNYLNISALLLRDLKIAFKDVNGDAKLDLIFSGIAAGSSRGSIFYIQNIGNNTFIFDGGNIIDFGLPIGTRDNPDYFDINRDGLIDVLIGQENGNLSYYPNIGSKESPSFQLESSDFYGLGFSITRRNLSIKIADIDNNLQPDLITSDILGNLTVYEDFLNNLHNPKEGIPIQIKSVAQTGKPMHGKFGNRSWINTVDLFGTGKPLITIGLVQGGVNILKNIDAEGGTSNNNILVYPNPININTENTINIQPLESMNLVIFSDTGQVVMASTTVQSGQTIRLNPSNLAGGLYLVSGYKNGKIVATTKFVVTR